MTARPALFVVVALSIAACGGGSDEADISIPEITLITTTTEPPVFEAGDDDTVTSDDASDVSVASTEEPADSEPVDSADPSDPAATSDDSDAPVETATPTTATPTTETPITATPTTGAPTTEPTPETTQPPIGGDFVLGASGLGAVQFGADPEGTITFVSSLLGAPTFDTGWVPPFDIGPCGGSQVRQVSWNDLLLEFGDVSDITEGRDHLYAYYYGRVGTSTPSPAGFTTADGVGVGSTVAELIAANPATEFRQGDDFIEPNFSISNSLAGLLSGLADDDVIEVFIGGLPCNG
ncbi:MAG: hypothetical protein AB8G14_12185 [Ilumatobacter sp.]